METKELSRMVHRLTLIVEIMSELVGNIEHLPPDNNTILHINHLKFLEGYYSGQLDLLKDKLKQEVKECQHGQSAF